MYVLLFIVILLVLIVGHEFGHLLMAKRAGMKVPEFGIGFPPKLWGTKIGDTEYTVNALPFGGFVRIVGEDAEDSADPDSFVHKAKGAQALTLFAGPFANVVLGFAAFWVAFMFGMPSAVTAEEAAALSDARVIVSEVLPGSPADDAGLLVGDTLVTLAQADITVPVQSPEDVTSTIAASPEPLTVTVRRGEEVKTVTVTPAAGVIPDEPGRYAVGIGSVLVGNVVLNPFSALLQAGVATYNSLISIVAGLAGLVASAFTGAGSLESLTGPVGIAGMVGDAATLGVGQVLALAAIISLNLAVLNLLPFPALDGGRLLFLAIETLRGKSISSRTAGAVNTAGFAILILLMLVVTWNDIARLLV